MKERLLYVKEIIEGFRGRPFTAGDVARRLEDRYGICVNRKTVYSDVAALTVSGMDIRKKNPKYFFHVSKK